ncbi:hypothetical protein SDC9_198051 [bioreactor metagenome]|uniref:Uncharacterized protein n=1 Tax=bioreactor metagenome TaxID=1076179 RepID=A0A645IGL6_9ZZZZ
MEVEIKFQSREIISQELVKGIMKKYSNKIMFKMGDNPTLGYQLKGHKKEELIDYLKEFMEYIQTIIETK